MYRFLGTPRWLALAAVVAIASWGMVLLGNWQLDRYRERSAVNARIDAAATTAPVPLAQLVPPPVGTRGVGPGPAAAAQWRRVEVTGRYDPDQEIIVRSRTVAGRVGFELVTPLRLVDGTAVLVDRGWVAPTAGDVTANPRVPPATSGLVTVVGRLHLSESRADRPDRRDGRIEVRRIGLPQLASALPYPLFGAYLLLDSPADADLVPVPSRGENAWQNGGYAVQWWLFAAFAVVGFGWQVRREAHPPAATPAAPTGPESLTTRATAAAPAPPAAPGAAPAAAAAPAARTGGDVRSPGPGTG